MHNLFFLSLSRGRVLAISHKLLCIRLSSLLCCEPRLPRTSGEAVTQGGPLSPLPLLLAVLQSHLKPRIRRGFLSIHLPVSRRSLFPPFPDFEPFPPGRGGRGSTPCLRYLARIPAYNYTGLRLCISCMRA